MANSTMPRFFALKSVYNDKYLCYQHEEGETNKYVKFAGEGIVSPYVKFEAVKAGKGLVHIRCCYNNKYWVRVTETSFYIAASAEEPEEDQSNVLCTLFEPLFIDAKTLRIRQVQLGHYACLWRSAAPYTDCVSASVATTDGNKCDVYTIVDWESVAILPKHVAFKGDNGFYLSARTIEGHPYLEFAANDIGDPSVANEVFANNDGSIRVKSNLFSKFWRRSPNWIWTDSDDFTTKNSDTIFQVIKIDNNVYAIRNLGNNQFCKRLTTGGKNNCLNADVSTISKDARIQVEELVLSRSIYYVIFRLTDARTYDQNVVKMAYGSADNKTQESKTLEVKLSYTETKSSTWNSSASVKLGGNPTIQSDIPVIANDGKVKLLDEFIGVHQWGKTETSEKTVGTVYRVALPPMTMVRVNLLATKGSCDVPFSYTQRDVLTNGEHLTTDMDDGVYTGVNYYSYKFEIKQESLA